jgi:two-component system nitrogen regulation sensor histidine kinase NtrY
VQQSETASLQIKISDNGHGFQPEVQDKIFLPFYTTPENGSGIALSLLGQIMRLPKGSISANSSIVGVGSESVEVC